MTLDDMMFTNNSASVAGAIVNNQTLTITGSTFSMNSGTNGAGAIRNYGTISITNSTFAGNSGNDNEGGAIYNGGTLTVMSSTFTSNGAGYAGSVFNAGTFTFGSSIFFGNGDAYGSDDIDPYDTMHSLGYNLIGVTTGCSWWGCVAYSPGPGDKTGVATDGLGALGNNGGPTQTELPSATSLAVGAVPVASCMLTSDQRGKPRPSSLHPGFCDVGAVERQSSDP